MSNLQDIVVREMKVKPQIDVEKKYKRLNSLLRVTYNLIHLSNH